MKRNIQIAIGLLLGAFLVWFLFRDTNWANVRDSIEAANWLWLGIAFVCVMVSFFTRSQRWLVIVRTTKPVSFRGVFNAMQIGFLANYTLPLRAGEVLRAVVLARRAQLPFPKCMAFVALDRVTDLFGLLAVLLITAIFFHPERAIELPQGMELPTWAQSLLEPNTIRQVAQVTALASSGIIGALVLLYLNQPLALRLCGGIVGLFSKKLAARANELLTHFAEGLHVFRSPIEMGKAIFWSLVTWALAGACFQCLIIAFHLDAPWHTWCLVLAMLSIAISLPGAPGFIGQYQAGIMLPLALAIPGISVDTAKAIAILGHLVNLLAVALVGVYSLHDEGTGLLALKQEGDQAAAHLHEEE